MIPKLDTTLVLVCRPKAQLPSIQRHYQSVPTCDDKFQTVPLKPGDSHAVLAIKWIWKLSPSHSFSICQCLSEVIIAWLRATLAGCGATKLRINTLWFLTVRPIKMYAIWYYLWRHARCRLHAAGTELKMILNVSAPHFLWLMTHQVLCFSSPLFPPLPLYSPEK